MSNSYPTEPVDPVTDNDEDNLDSGNRKLGLIAGAVVLVMGGLIAFGPAANRERIANGQMPTFELMEASVVGTREAEAPAATAAEATKEEEAEKPAAAATKAEAARTRKTANVETLTPTTASTVTTAAPAAEPAAPAAEPAPAAEEAPRMTVLSGRVLNENGRPLAGATVFVKGARKFASTDQNGNYTLEVPAGENTLVYGYGGYEDQEMRARSGQPQNVTLIPRETSARRRK